MRRTAFTQGLDGLFQLLRRRPCLLQNVVGFAVGYGESEQQALGRHIAIARLGRGLIGCVQRARQRRGHVHAVVAPLHFRQRLHGRIGLVRRLARIGAGAAQQLRRQPLPVVEQSFQEMLGVELLVLFAERDRLRGLHESARSLGELFHIHERPS